MTNLVEITKTETIKIRLGAIKTNSREDLKDVIFIKGQNLVTGELEQFATSAARADMFDHLALIDGNNLGKDFEVVVRVIPKAENGVVPAYKTRKAITIDGVDYTAGSLVPYRNLDGFKVIELCAVPKVQTIADKMLEEFKAFMGVDYNPQDPEHRKAYLELRKTM